MSNATTQDAQIRDARVALASYSDLHDADLTKLLLEVNTRVSLEFNAEAFNTGKISSILIVATKICDFVIRPRPVAEPGFEDYAFPTNSSVDCVDVEVRGDFISVVVQGTYGWRIEISCDGIYVEAVEVEA